MDKLTLVYMTAGSLEEARSLAKDIIEARLAACVNYWQNIASVYRWEEALCEEQEVVMIIKTTDAKYEELCSFVESHHSYAIPCILKLGIDAANAAYANWLREEVSPLAERSQMRST
jgi:periplasmic divalent cation tolerance protein